MNNDPIYQQGDKVFYIGTKHKQALTSKEGKPCIGWVHAAVLNEPGTYVIEFPETKEHDSYIMHASSLSQYRPSKTEGHTGPEVKARRPKKEDD